MAKQKRPDRGTHMDLHMHTHYGEFCALTKPDALVHHTVEQGRTAVGVADRNSVQAFPELEKAGQTYGVKILYGLETTMQNDVDATAGNPPSSAITNRGSWDKTLRSKGDSKTCIVSLQESNAPIQKHPS